MIAVCILAGLRHEAAGMADPDISADAVEDAAHRDGGIRLRRQKDLRHHGGGGGLSVGAGNGHGVLVVFHHLPQKLRPGQHGEVPADRLFIFRIVGMDGRRIYDDLNVAADIGGPLAQEDPGTVVLKMICQRAGVHVGAAHLKAPGEEHLGQAAHTDAADPDKMNSRRFLKIDLIHSRILPFSFYPL